VTVTSDSRDVAREQAEDEAEYAEARAAAALARDRAFGFARVEDAA
jgi:hypothetical protein